MHGPSPSREASCAPSRPGTDEREGRSRVGVAVTVSHDVEETSTTSPVTVPAGRSRCGVVALGLLRSHLGGLLQGDHDLTECVTGLHCSQCLWRLVEGVGLEHLRIDFARGDQGGDGGNAR